MKKVTTHDISAVKRQVNGVYNDNLCFAMEKFNFSERGIIYENAKLHN